MFKTIKTAADIQAEKDQAAKEQRNAELKQLLAGTDYVALSDYDKDKPDVLAQRQAWREELRELEQTL
jgi:hypothetical protein